MDDGAASEGVLKLINFGVIGILTNSTKILHAHGNWIGNIHTTGFKGSRNQDTCIFGMRYGELQVSGLASQPSPGRKPRI